MSELTERPVRVGITHGDFNGIGYEVIIKAFADHGMLEMCTPIVYGIHKAATYYRKALEQQEFSFYGIQDASKAVKNHCNFVNLSDLDVGMNPGESSPAAGSWAVKSIQRAMQDLEAGLIDVIVTAPINKQNVQGPEFNFPGHTEYFASKTGNSNYLMMLVNENLRVGTVTGHVPIQEVASKISVDLIMSRLKVMEHSLVQDFGIRGPKIAVLGLNPHAGDGGVIGKEEEQIIIPALKKAQQENMYVFGPFAADGFFGSGAWKSYDGVLAMYHDQGLIPFKSIAFHHGVNCTAGLPIVRTSPDHGTGYDIVGKNVADPSSLREAVYLAIDIFRNRKIATEINADPLKQQTRRERERY